RLFALDSLDKCDGLALGPTSVVALGLGKEGAMSAMSGFDIGNVRIAQQLLAGFGQHANKRVVIGVHHQRRYSDALEHAGGRGARVVILGIEKTKMARGYLVVEIADATHSAQMAQLELPGIERSFALEAPPQAPKEFHFV